jgi:hypothetical protein
MPASTVIFTAFEVRHIHACPTANGQRMSRPTQITIAASMTEVEAVIEHSDTKRLY